jgi:hypothetical protein
MAAKARLGIGRAHPLPVVCNDNAVAACVFEVDHDPARTSVQGIFHQLLDHRAWTLHHFARSDLVRHVLWQPLN